MPLIQSSASLVTVFLPVDAVPQGTPLTTDAVEIAFVRGADVKYGPAPAGSAWVPAQWYDVRGQTCAGVLVGTGGDVVLAPGNWVAWVRVTDNPDVPALPVDVVTIT